MKKILINGLLLTKQYSGVQYSIEYLIQALSKSKYSGCKFTVLVSKNYEGALIDTPNLSLIRVPFDSSSRLRRIFFENFYLPKYFLSNKFDLYHSPGYILPYFSSIPSIVTIHDLIALSFPSLCSYATAIYFNIFLCQSIKKAKKIIAVSNSVKTDILKRFPNIEEATIEVIYHGVHSRFKKELDSSKLVAFKKKHALPNKFLLFVGNLEPKKNLLKVVDAFCYLKKTKNIEHQLLIVGKKGWKYSPLFHLLKENEWEKDIVLMGYLNEDDLPLLYSLAEVFLFPSIYEGFGLPVLEAMACKCPVIISDRGSLPEISGGICPQVNPNNSDEIAVNIWNTITNKKYKNKLIKKGYIWSKSFTWQKAATAAIELYKR